MAVFLVQACAPRALEPSPLSATATSAPPAHAPEIGIALIGPVAAHNVWALFAGQDYSHNTYAVRAAYWPRLYGLSIPDQVFGPLTASDLPTAVHQEGAFFAATVPVRTDLHWSDGAAFSAEDVAFTVNTALRFELGFDWQDFYDPQVLDHAEAAAPGTVKFIFRQRPGVQEWQYGVLMGPVVQEAYWAAKVAGTAESLPPGESYANIDALNGKIGTLQQQVDKLYAALLSAQGEDARLLQADLRRQQGNLDEATNDREEIQAGIDAAMQSARRLLFELDDTGEPLLGAWLPERPLAGNSTNGTIVNLPNPAYPGPAPNFDRLVFHLFENAEAADAAMQEGAVNLVLDLPAASEGVGATMTSPTRSVRLLLFNPSASSVGEVALRQALACLIDQDEMTRTITGTAALHSFVAPQEGMWYSPQSVAPCMGKDAAARLGRAVELLAAAGYTWQHEPSLAEGGEGLMGPGGSTLPSLELLAPDSDPARTAAAAYVEQKALLLGMPLRMLPMPEDALDYAVLSSAEYDLAVMGYRVGAFPGYLCDWFGAGGTFTQGSGLMTSLCGELKATSDLEAARSFGARDAGCAGARGPDGAAVFGGGRGPLSGHHLSFLGSTGRPFGRRRRAGAGDPASPVEVLDYNQPQPGPKQHERVAARKEHPA